MSQKVKALAGMKKHLTNDERDQRKDAEQATIR